MKWLRSLFGPSEAERTNKERIAECLLAAEEGTREIRRLHDDAKRMHMEFLLHRINEKFPETLRRLADDDRDDLRLAREEAAREGTVKWEDIRDIDKQRAADPPVRERPLDQGAGGHLPRDPVAEDV